MRGKTKAESRTGKYREWGKVRDSAKRKQCERESGREEKW